MEKRAGPGHDGTTTILPLIKIIINHFITFPISSTSKMMVE